MVILMHVLDINRIMVAPLQYIGQINVTGHEHVTTHTRCPEQLPMKFNIAQVFYHLTKFQVQIEFL